MKVDCSEAEQCDYVFVTQESEPSSVVASSVTSMPDGSPPVEPLGHGSAVAIVSASTSSPAQCFSLTPPVTTSVCSEPAPLFGLFGASSTSSQVLNRSSPFVFKFPPPSPTPSAPAQASVTHVPGSGASAVTTPSIFKPMQAPAFGSSASATSTSSTSSPFAAPSASLEPPVQASASNTSSLFSFRPAQGFGNTSFASPFGGISPPASNTATTTVIFGTTPVTVSSTSGPTQNFAKTSSVFAPSSTPNNPFSFRAGPNPTPTTGFDPFSTFSSIGRGTRYYRYEPTPADEPGPCIGMMMSISASNYYLRKSHEELRWEDYQRGDKGEVGSFPAAHISPTFSRPNDFFSQPTVTAPSLSAPPRTPDHSPSSLFAPPRRPHFPAALQRPHDGVSSQASGCTACGATSSSFAFGPTNPPSGATSSSFSFGPKNPPSAATSPLPGSWFSTSGFYPNLAAQGTRTTPALQPYPMMFGPAYLAAQGTATTPALQVYPMMFAASPAAQGTNLSVQSATPALQAYPMMLGASPAGQAYPVAGYVLLPFPTMSLQ
ncbi:unnamed protein product [Thlaspi arvense]|uniref:Uncharacterized protein n=1 Tax=Thlaspi arvense TaxID=13288 RepID=A0AAU9RVV2_THLAR|nr:unnamed protein product [Thlaspi arvense]